MAIKTAPIEEVLNCSLTLLQKFKGHGKLGIAIQSFLKISLALALQNEYYCLYEILFILGLAHRPDRGLGLTGTWMEEVGLNGNLSQTIKQ